MSGFVSGATSAFNKVLTLVEILDPEVKNEVLKYIKTQIELYKELYKQFDDNIKTTNVIKPVVNVKSKGKKMTGKEALEKLEKIKQLLDL